MSGAFFFLVCSCSFFSLILAFCSLKISIFWAEAPPLILSDFWLSHASQTGSHAANWACTCARKFHFLGAFVYSSENIKTTKHNWCATVHLKYTLNMNNLFKWPLSNYELKLQIAVFSPSQAPRLRLVLSRQSTPACSLVSAKEERGQMEMCPQAGVTVASLSERSLWMLDTTILDLWSWLLSCGSLPTLPAATLQCSAANCRFFPNL